ncbi:ABC transporter permease [Pseudomonas farris]
MNPHAPQQVSIRALMKSVWHNRGLIMQLTRREVIGRYRGSALGLAWSFLNPLFTLVVYTFVFSVVFKARWGSAGGDVKVESQTMFAIMLFIGLIIHGVFAEVINKAPMLIVSNVNYAKKVIFPLEILPIIAMGGAVFHALISIFILLVVFVIFQGVPEWTALFLPIVLLPLIILTLGISWMLASIGVFLRDVGQATAIITTMMLFLSPVLFPLSAVPEKFHPFIKANPLTFIIEQSRNVLVWGVAPDFKGLAIYLLVSILVAWLGFVWFQKTRKGFTDVL